jgi:hypothetical protein
LESEKLASWILVWAPTEISFLTQFL